FSGPVARRFDERRESRQDEMTRGIDPAIEINRGDYRFEAVRENRVLLTAAGLLFPASKQDEPAEIDAFREPGERRGGHHSCFDFRFVALAVRGELMEQEIRNHESQDRVSKKLQRLVVDDAA